MAAHSSSPGAAVVMDCGGLNARFGVVSSEIVGTGMRAPLANLIRIPNYIAHSSKISYIGDQTSSCPKYAGLFYRHAADRGYIVDWDCQEHIWNQAMDQQHLGVSPADSNLLLQTSILAPNEITERMFETVFEDFEFKSLFSTNPPTMAANNYKMDHPKSVFSQSSSCLVVDSGYSFTHTIPFHNNQPMYAAAKRLEIGGKLLTNALKDIVSMRYWNMMEETYLINHIKEQLCYVASNFDLELEVSKKTKSIKREFVLPDYVNSRTGFVKQLSTEPSSRQISDDQVLPLNNERFSIPEILFSPSNIGIDQCGLAEMVVKSIIETPPEMHAQLYSNILLMGGNVSFRGFKARFENELRAIVPDMYSVRVHVPDDPIMCGLYGGMQWCATNGVLSGWITKKEYEEKGYEACMK